MMTQTTTVYVKLASGHREFDVAGRRYRAFWLRDKREWSVIEVGLDGQKIAPDYKQAWTQPNWSEVESFVAWRAKESGSDITGLRITP